MAVLRTDGGGVGQAAGASGLPCIAPWRAKLSRTRVAKAGSAGSNGRGSGGMGAEFGAWRWTGERRGWSERAIDDCG